MISIVGYPPLPGWKAGSTKGIPYIGIQVLELFRGMCWKEPSNSKHIYNRVGAPVPLLYYIYTI